MSSFRTLRPGFSTTVQDLGRYGCLRYGVPICGAMDSFSLVGANLLVSNDVNDACLETTLIGPELRAEEKSQIAITGGHCSPRINGQSVSMWQTLAVKEGDVVSLGRLESGCRAYVSLRGGIKVPKVLGSRSTFLRGALGGLEGRRLRVGDDITCFEAPPINVEYEMPQELIPQFSSQVRARVIVGPQDDMFTEKGMKTFFSARYRVTSEADRMGYRLEGPTVEHRGKADIVSDTLLPGAIQVPKNGKPIILMRDAQTTGGYPKIAVVIAPDLDLLGQARPNQFVEFSRIELKQAYEKYREYDQTLEMLPRMLIRKT